MPNLTESFDQVKRSSEIRSSEQFPKQTQKTGKGQFIKENEKLDQTNETAFVATFVSFSVNLVDKITCKKCFTIFVQVLQNQKRFMQKYVSRID